MRLAGLLAVVSLAAGCHVNAEAKASTSGDARADMKAETEEAPAPPPEAAPAPPPVSVTASGTPACPIACYAASGAARSAVTPDEQTRLSSALAPVFVRIDACTEGARGPAPTLNLRIAPNGALADLGVDPRHAGSEACMESAARDGAVDVSLPGRTDVRCREECPKPVAQGTSRRAKKKR